MSHKMAAIHHILALYSPSWLYLMEAFYLKVISAITDPDDIMATFVFVNYLEKCKSVKQLVVICLGMILYIKGSCCIYEYSYSVIMLSGHSWKPLFLCPSEIQSVAHSWSEYITCTMGKRYYCDYCDRSFQDNMHNRKKHLNGVQHHRAKKAWFDYFKGDFYI